MLGGWQTPGESAKESWRGWERGKDGGSEIGQERPIHHSDTPPTMKGNSPCECHGQRETRCNRDRTRPYETPREVERGIEEEARRG